MSTKRSLLAVLALFTLPGQAGAQDSVAVQAGARYEAGSLHRRLFGSGYRELWTAPIRVPTLRPDTAYGGLEFLELGGGSQTVSVQLVAPDGREFVFRSVDKNQEGGLHPDLHDTLIEAIVQDQVSAKHPGAALVVAPLLEAAGVLHAEPRLAVMEDWPGLGEHRATFAGMLGTLEERPTEEATVGEFSGYERVIGTERLLERLAESAEDRPAPEAYLRARLMDFLVGDWDRHPDQWRWAQLDRDGRRFWLPIPRDRDNAFFRADGLVSVVGSALRPNVTAFGPTYDDYYPLLHNAQPLDRRILPELERPAWLDAAAELQARITDDVIADAVARLPEPYRALNGPELAAALRARRDSLHVAAADVYAILAESVEVYGTDEDDRARLERNADGTVTVEMSDGDGRSYFRRTFSPGETREVRVRLEGGDDEGEVTGTGPVRMNVRLIGGAGDDVLRDATRGADVFFHDDEGANTFVPARGTHVDRRPYAPRETSTVAENNAPPPRDWGSDFSMFSPAAEWLSEVGPAIGGGPTWTRYGFRRDPHAVRSSITLLYAPLGTRFGAEGEIHRVHTGGRTESRIAARATQLPVTRFYGLGNETPAPGSSSHHRVWSNELAASVELVRRAPARVAWMVGVLAERVDPEPVDELPAALRNFPGMRSFGAAGVRVGMEFDGRDSNDIPRSGFQIGATADGFPLVWGDAPEAFTDAEALATLYLPVPAPLETTLALRIGGAKTWGDAPIQHRAFIGGGSSLRGFRTQRFAGDAAAFAGAELRTRITHLNLWVIRGEIGGIAGYDVGRVWWDGATSDVWHSAPVIGGWFAALDRALVGHAVYSYGEGHRVSAGLGVPF